MPRWLLGIPGNEPIPASEEVGRVHDSAELRTWSYPHELTIVRDDGRVFVWNAASVAVDTGGEDSLAVAINNGGVGRYVFAAASFAVYLSSGNLLAAHGINATEARISSVANGLLSIPDTDPFWFRHLSQPNFFWYDARDGIISSAGIVDAAVDRSGANNNATQSGVPRPTLVQDAYDAGLAINFAAGQYLLANGALKQLQNRSPRTLVAWIKPSSIVATRDLFAALTGGVAVAGFLGDVPRIRNIGATDITSISDGSVNVLQDRWQLIAFIVAPGAGQSSVYCNGRLYVFPGDAMPAGNIAPTEFYLASGWLGEVRMMGGFAGALVLEDFKTLHRRLYGQCYASVVCDGNSLTGATTYPAYIGDILAGLNWAQSIGVPAQTTPQMTADFVAQTTPLKRNASCNIISAWEIRNDMYVNGVSAAQAVANYWAYVDQAVANGWDVLAWTCPPMGDLAALGRSADLVDANNLVLAGYQAHGCFDVVRPDLSVQLSDFSNTLYRSDTVHFTNAGDRLLGLLAWEKLRRYIATL